MDQTDTIDITVCDSNLDNTYDLGLDTSIAVLRYVAQTNDKMKEDKPKQNTTNDSATDSETLAEKQTIVDFGIKCTDDCKIKADSPSICCKTCMEWYHPKCVGIKILMTSAVTKICTLSKITNDNLVRQHPENGDLQKRTHRKDGK